MVKNMLVLNVISRGVFRMVSFLRFEPFGWGLGIWRNEEKTAIMHAWVPTMRMRFMTIAATDPEGYFLLTCENKLIILSLS